ncbi:MAG TPA: DUF3800 domain-containing protein [Pyrinomonadaceae bacterium]|nr:DUF3800 domain-containing protein [Pyrinomonadaceae bacterium]
MPNQHQALTHCYVDESIHDSHGFAVAAFIFTDAEFDSKVAVVLRSAGLRVPDEEYKSSARMDSDPRMREARASLTGLLTTASRVAIVVGPFNRPRLGRQVLQALQSVVVRNGVKRETLRVFFDREVFTSQVDADRLHKLFHALQGVAIHAQQDSRLCFGVQAADAVAHAFGQIIKDAAIGAPKLVDVGGEGAGYPPHTMAPLGWELLMQFRHSLFTRPVVYNGAPYLSECDPVVLDPMNDDLVSFAQHPVLIGWGVQIAPESNSRLRLITEETLGTLWLGCIH